MTGNALLQVQDLRVQFFTSQGVVKAVNGVSFELLPGQVLGLVGESGCGKTMTMLSLLRLVPDPPGKIVGGEIRFQGRNLLELDNQEMRRVRGAAIGFIPQEPMTSLNPVLSIGRQMTEILEIHLKLDRRSAKRKAVELLEMVGIPEAPRRLSGYPHQLSGGIRQRVMIAMALACRPSLILADEPTTALDVTVQAQILDLMTSLARELGTAVIIVTHNLGIIARCAQKVNVMYAGQIVESAPAVDLYRRPLHPYTLGLLGSVPRLDRGQQDKLKAIEGSPPDLAQLPPGCAFRPRCNFIAEDCLEDNPPLFTDGDNHHSACWAWKRVAGETNGVNG